jgi:cbb3-type cytochrome oxidase subunit 3
MAINNTESSLNFKKHCLSPGGNGDADGAAAFVIIVIIWYFIGVAVFVLWQIKRKRNISETKSNLLLQSMEDHIKTKELLGMLFDWNF